MCQSKGVVESYGKVSDVILCPAKEKHPEKMLIRRVDMKIT